MSPISFEAVIEILGINPYVLISSEQAEALRAGWRKPMPVRIRVNGQPSEPWRINMMPVGDGSFYLYLHGEVRKASGTKVGDRVSVWVEFDETYRSGPAHPMPEWFAEALESHEAAKANWEALPPSRQKEVLRYLAALKSPAAQARNLERAMRMLSGESGRFMARDWEGGA
jgi:hypothetical protein